MTLKVHRALALGVVLLLTAAPARAQVDRATVSGAVKDSNGGVLPGATVIVTNLATDLESRRRRGMGRGCCRARCRWFQPSQSLSPLC